MSFLDIAAAIASALGEGWAAEPGYVQYTEHAVLRHPDGRCLDLRSGNGSHRRSEHSRVIIRGDFGQLSRYGAAADRTHTITVADTRSPVEIAREIVRRLLPDYEVDLAVCRTRDQAQRAAVARRDAIVEAVQAIFPGSRVIWDNHISFGARGDNVSGTVRVLHNCEAEFTLTVPASHVLSFTRLVAAARPASRTPLQAAHAA